MDAFEATSPNARKTLAFAEAVQSADRFLVVGCGERREVGILARKFRATVVGAGIDGGCLGLRPQSTTCETRI